MSSPHLFRRGRVRASTSNERLASFLLGLWASSWLAPGTAGGRTNPAWPAHSLIDRDGNGLPDYACAGDFDQDGVLEIDDLQDVVNGLTDSGPKLILVTPGVYLPPAEWRRAGRSHALLELGSFTTLECSAGRTILLGGPLTAGWNYAVVGNHDHRLGNDAVWIKRCEIDGGAPPTYASNSFPQSQRMGVWFRRTRHSGVSDSYVHDTVHAGLYTSNSTGDQFLRNRVDDVGGYGDITGLWRQPCIYLFASGGGAVLSDFQAIGNALSRCGHSGLNTRAEHTDAPGDVIRNCGCSGGVWTPIASAALPGIDFADGAMRANVLLERISVKNARGVTGMHVGGTLSAFSVQTILGADDSLATDVDQRSAARFDATSGFTVTGAGCVGTQSGVPCIE